MSAIKCADNEKVARDMLGERFRQQAAMGSHYSRSLVVATCTGELTLSELPRDMRVNDDVSEKDAAELRRTMAKQQIRADCSAGLRRFENHCVAQQSTDASSVRGAPCSPHSRYGAVELLLSNDGTQYESCCSFNTRAVAASCVSLPSNPPCTAHRAWRPRCSSDFILPAAAPPRRAVWGAGASGTVHPGTPGHD